MATGKKDGDRAAELEAADIAETAPRDCADPAGVETLRCANEKRLHNRRPD
jgi:hypothetical protein